MLSLFTENCVSTKDQIAHKFSCYQGISTVAETCRMHDKVCKGHITMKSTKAARMAVLSTMIKEKKIDSIKEK